jgi:shikimate kinase
VKTSIAIIGFMGTGKTTVGKVLSAKLGKEFVEMDALIEKKAGRSIPEIFRDEGEIGFRELEIGVAREVAGRQNVVIACGGGVVLNKINIDRLRQEALIICLKASPAVIVRRTAGDEAGRPLLAVADRARRVREMLQSRRPYYESAADITVDTSRRRPETVAVKIMEKIKEYENRHK